MKYTFAGKQYEILLGSDVNADEMYLEAREPESDEVILYAVWSDADGSFTFSAYKPRLPFDLVEFFVKMARERLPDTAAGEQNPPSN